jgi:hypothetical protein
MQSKSNNNKNTNDSISTKSNDVQQIGKSRSITNLEAENGYTIQNLLNFASQQYSQQNITSNTSKCLKIEK